MANIKRIDGKLGTSYKITVAAGRALSGKQIRHYKTWTPLRGMTERQMEKEVQKVAYEFEQAIGQGFQADNRQTFSEYADYVIDLKERTGAKPETTATYRTLKRRVDSFIGHIRISDIRPNTLNQFYGELGKPGARQDQGKAYAIVNISTEMKKLCMCKSELSRKANVSMASLQGFCSGGGITQESAHKVAEVLNVKDSSLYQIKRDMTPLSTKTILEHHRFISVVLGQAEREMLVQYNAATKATPPKHKRKEANYFQPDVLHQILEALESEPIKWRTITHLMIVTGARRGEVMGLSWDKIDWESGQITIDANLLYDPGKGIYISSTKTGNIRYVFLPEETMALLKKYRAWYNELRLTMGDMWQGEKNRLLFVRDDGRPMNPDSISAWLPRFAKRHNLPRINPHAFRHSAASILIDSGVDLLSVSKQLGHTMTSTTTDIYGHLIAKSAERNRDCISQVLLKRPS